MLFLQLDLPSLPLFMNTLGDFNYMLLTLLGVIILYKDNSTSPSSFPDHQNQSSSSGDPEEEDWKKKVKWGILLVGGVLLVGWTWWILGAPIEVQTLSSVFVQDQLSTSLVEVGTKALTTSTKEAGTQTSNFSIIPTELLTQFGEKYIDSLFFTKEHSLWEETMNQKGLTELQRQKTHELVEHIRSRF